MIKILGVRFTRINRPELYLALAALCIYLFAAFIASSSMDSSIGVVLIELASFFKKVSTFFGGFVVAVFAAPLMTAHDPHINPTQRIYIYAARYMVGIAFLVVL